MYSVSMRLTFELTDGSVVDTLGTNSRFDKCVTRRDMERPSGPGFRAVLAESKIFSKLLIVL